MTHLGSPEQPALRASARQSARRATTLLLLLSSTLPALAAKWSAPIDVSRAAQPAAAVATLVDSHGNEHLLFEAGDYGVNELFHTYRAPGESWSEPTQVSHTGFGATLPNRPGYPFFLEDAGGRIHLFFESLEGIPGAVQVWHTTLQSSSPGGGWSTPTNVSQASQPATAEAVLLDSDNTLHLVFSAIPGVGTAQLFHAFRPAGGSWSDPTQVSHSDQGALFPAPSGFNDLSPQYHFFQEDDARHLHLFFEAIPGLGVRQVWHTAFDLDHPGDGWTGATNVSQASEPTRAKAALVDGQGNLHLIFRTIPDIGPPQLFHAFRGAGGFWSSPSQITQTGYAATLPQFRGAYAFVQEDGTGLLHLFFESIGSFGYEQVWHTDLDTASPGAGWSDAVDVSQYPNPARAEAVTFDENGTLHLVFSAVPVLGARQLYHSYRLPGQGFSFPTLVSHTGSAAFLASYDDRYAFLRTDGRGALHLFFRSIPDGIGVTQVWHTELQTANPAAGWSPEQNISQSPEPAFAEALVVDSTGAQQVVFRAIPGQGASQLHHVECPAGGEWASPVMVSRTEQAATLPDSTDYRFVYEHGGFLHLTFDAIPDAVGVKQVWHTELPLDPSILFADGFESGDPSAWSAVAP